MTKAETNQSARETQLFKKEARQMFKKMAATIDLSSVGALPDKYP
jgi:hypothetical protein